MDTIDTEVKNMKSEDYLIVNVSKVKVILYHANMPVFKEYLSRNKYIHSFEDLINYCINHSATMFIPTLKKMSLRSRLQMKTMKIMLAKNPKAFMTREQILGLNGV